MCRVLRWVMSNTLFVEAGLVLLVGWFCWSVGFTAVVWGGCFSKMRRKNLKIEILALVVQIYGAGLLFVGPLAVQLHEIHWHFFSLVVIGVSVTIYLSLIHI